MSRFELWKHWYKHCLNHPVYKILVLLRLAHSPSFEMYRGILEQIEQDPNLSELKSVKDEKPEKVKKESDVNWGWYIVYLLMVIINGLIYIARGYDPLTWQYWAGTLIVIISFISGAEYRKKGD